MPAVYTALSEQLVASRHPLFALASTGGVSALRDVTTIVGSGAFSTVNSEIVVDTGATAASEAVLKTAQQGVVFGTLSTVASMTVRVSGTPSGQQAGLWGYFDDNNGFGFGVDSGGLYVFSRLAGTDTKVAQASWNGDKLDGTGGSSLTMSATEATVYAIEFYPDGSVIFRVILPNATKVETGVVVHTLVAATPAAATLNLPITATALNGTTASSFKVYVGSREFSVLGELPHSDRMVAHYMTGVSVSNTAFSPVMNLRKKTTGNFPSIRAKLACLEVSASSPLLVQVVSDTALDTPSWVAPSDYPAAETAVEVDVTDTSPSGGSVIAQHLIASGSTCTLIHDGISLVANGRNYSIRAKAIGQGTGAVFNLRWVENW